MVDGTTKQLSNIDCNPYCAVGTVINELTAEAELDPSVFKEEATEYLKSYPCKFVIAGKCRLSEFLIRKELNLNLKEARLEPTELYGK